MVVDRKGHLEREIAAAIKAAGRAHAGPGPALELAKLYLKAGRLAAADAVLKAILEADSGQATALFLKARIEFIRGELTAAGKTATLAIAADPMNTSAYYLLSMLPDQSLDAAGLGTLESLLGTGDLPPGAVADGAFALGHFLERRGAWDAAFEAFREANAAQAAEQGGQGLAYNPGQTEARLEMFREFLGPEALRGIGGQGSDSDLPIFVIGMPRSGTTLVERILAAHSRVMGCGEREDLRDCVRRLAGLSEGLDLSGFLRVLGGELAGWAASYLEVRDPGEGGGPGAGGDPGEGGGFSRIVDKAPLNFEHLGLVELLFPAARVIVVRRDARDVCLSIYRQKLRSSHLYATSLAHLGHFHRQFEAQMDFWRANLNLAFLDLVYEDLVADPGVQARRLLEFAGLDWEEGCLEFYRQEGEVASLSGAQVRRPISRTSVGRWRRYERHLGPLIKALEAD